jgi:hypothetical protein
VYPVPSALDAVGDNAARAIVEAIFAVFFALRAVDVFFVALRAAVVAVVFFALRAVEFCIALRAAVVWMAVLRALDVFLMLVLRALFSVLSARAVETRLVSVERVTIFFTLSVVALRATELLSRTAALAPPTHNAMDIMYNRILIIPNI